MEYESHEEPHGTAHINGQPIKVYQEELVLPDDDKRRALCYRHLAEGAGALVENDFWLAGCHFPEQGEPQEIRYGLSCQGASWILKHCNLVVLQHDADGEIIGRMAIEN